MSPSTHAQALRRIPLAFLMAAVLLLPALLWDLRREGLAQLTRQQGDANVALGGLLANGILPEFEDMLALALAEQTPPALMVNARRAQLGQRVAAALRGLPVLKVKLYSVAGVTLYSSESKQTGENKADNPAFQAALHGVPTSQLVHRDTFNSFERQLAELDLVTSYIPVRLRPDGQVVGVLELYSDVTDVLAHQSQSTLHRGLATFAAFLILFGVVNALSRRTHAAVHAAETARSKQARTVAELALRDELTGMLNRTAWKQRLNKVGRLAEGTAVAVLVVDLDRFKPVNDNHGHAAGDLVLRETARRMKRCLRDGDMLFRIGGDEFIALLSLDVYDEDLPRAISSRIVAAASGPVDIGSCLVQIGASVGVAIGTVDAASLSDLAAQADAALYRAKSDGRGTVVLASAMAFAATGS